MRLPEIRVYCKKAGFNLSKERIGQLFYLSLLTVIDTVHSKKMR